MDHRANIPISIPLHLEASRSKARSTKAEHMYMFSLISILGVLLQLKQAAGTPSLFDTDYPTMVMLVGASVLYGVSLVACPYILKVYPNSDLEAFMNKMSLLFGSLASISEILVLVPNFGLLALVLWFGCFVSLLAFYSFQYLKTWYERAVALVAHVFGKLKESLNMIISPFTKKPEPEEQTGLP